MRVYRFYDHVKVTGMDATPLTPDEAKRLAFELNRYADDVRRRAFTDSTLGSTDIKVAYRV